jgi:hypothetical protein
MRWLLGAVVVLAACLGTLRSTSLPGVALIDGGMRRNGVLQLEDRCARKYDADAVAVAGALLAEVRARGLLQAPQFPKGLRALGKPIGVLWEPTLLSRVRVIQVPRMRAAASAGVIPTPPLAICIVDHAPPLDCGIPVYGCSIPLKDVTNVYVAGQALAEKAYSATAWKHVLAHELLCSLAYMGQMAGWPLKEADVIKRSDYREILAKVAPL